MKAGRKARVPEENETRPAEAGAKTIVITRVFDVPRELVFEAWTRAEYLLRWYAPRGCTIHFSKLDVRPGGAFHSCIHNPAFGDCWCIGEYREIVRPARLVYTLAIADERGNRIEPAQTGHDPDWPAETLVTVTFEEQDGKTRLTLRQNVLESLAKRTGAYPSWLDMLDHLADTLSTLEIDHAG